MFITIIILYKYKYKYFIVDAIRVEIQIFLELFSVCNIFSQGRNIKSLLTINIFDSSSSLLLSHFLLSEL